MRSQQEQPENGHDATEIAPMNGRPSLPSPFFTLTRVCTYYRCKEMLKRDSGYGKLSLGRDLRVWSVIFLISPRQQRPEGLRTSQAQF